jgi:hypothetical protein
MLGNVTFKHCPREANEVAYDLARECFSNNIFYNWIDELPSFILSKLLNDVTEL